MPRSPRRGRQNWELQRGFAGTQRGASAAAGLTTLTEDGFGAGPRIPLKPAPGMGISAQDRGADA